MEEMNNNNSNKYYYKPYHPMPNNPINRSHHPANMFDNQRNDYFNGPPGYMGPPMVNNNNMIPSGGYNHFTNSYPAGGNGPFYRDFRQNWQPQMLQPQQMPQHRPMPPPPPQTQTQTQPPSSTPSISQGQSLSSPSSNLVNRGISSSSTTVIITNTTTSSSSSSSSSRNNNNNNNNNNSNRLTDEHTLIKLKQHLAVTQKELMRVTAEKLKLELEEQRLQKIVDKSKLEVDRLESRLRDPRVKNRPDSISDLSTPSSLDRSLTSNSTSTAPGLTSLSTTTVTNMLSTSVPICSVQNISTSEGLTFSSLLATTTPISTNSLNSLTSHSTTTIPTTPNVSNSLLIPSLTSLSVPNANNSGNTPNYTQMNGSLLPPIPPFSGATATSLLTPPNRNVNKNPVSRGKQLNNLVSFKPLPLVFDICPEEILKAEIYPANQTKVKVNFAFKPAQLDFIRRNPQYKILLRICNVKAKKTSQSDRVSRKLIIKINSKPFSLGKQTNGSIKAPLDITSYCTDIRNDLELCWPENEPGRDYGVGIYVNQRYTPDYALEKLQGKEYQRPSSEALKMIIKNFAASGDICSEEIMVPLCCPITKKRLEIPAIGTKCEHLACFDAKSFLDINQRRPEWHCPSCKKAIGFNDLRIDCLIVDILAKTTAECLKVSFDRNCAWHPVIENKEKESTPTLIDVNRIDIITLDDSDEENLKDGTTGVTQGEARMDLETEQEEEDEEDDEETEQEEETEEEDDEEDGDEEEEDEEEDSNEDTEEEGSRERRQKQFSEIFGSDSRENSPDSSVRSPVTRCRKRRGSERTDRRSKRKTRRNN